MPNIPKPAQINKSPDGSGAGCPPTGVLKVSAKAASIGLSAFSPMQYCPAAGLPKKIEPAELSLPSNVRLARLLQEPATPAE
jgi:hypothetical protein